MYAVLNFKQGERNEKDGWITKERSKTDKRAVNISLTEKAYQNKEAISFSILEEITACNLEGINEKQFLQYLKKLNQELSKTGKRSRISKNEKRTGA